MTGDNVPVVHARDRNLDCSVVFGLLLVLNLMNDKKGFAAACRFISYRKYDNQKN